MRRQVFTAYIVPAPLRCLILLLQFLGVVSSFPRTVAAQDSRYGPKDSLFSVPPCLEERWLVHTTCSPDELDAWRRDVMNWRDQTRARVAYDGIEYEQPQLSWSSSSFMQAQLMAHDRYFFDPVRGKYTVDKYLDDLQERFGGIDSVLIWPTYPNLGIDSRNQFDLIRAMPGGESGLRSAIEAFHHRGVRVFLPYNPWDRGTRPEAKPDAGAVAELAAAVNADGIFGDTMDGMAQEFLNASKKSGHPLVLEPEGFPSSAEMLKYNLMNWGYWRYPASIQLSEGKLIDPRHMTNISDRWNRSKIEDLQYAFFNGVGLMTWENLWGIWNGITPRSAEAIRRVATVERAAKDFLVSPQWEPLTPVIQFGIFASAWPLKDQVIITMVNRNEYAVNGPQIEFPWKDGVQYFDLWNGNQLVPQRVGDKALLSFKMEANGFGALWVTNTPAYLSLQELMGQSRKWSASPLAGFADRWQPLPQQVVGVQKTAKPKATPKDMAKIPAALFRFQVSGLEQEGYNWTGLDVQYPWEDSPRRHHAQIVPIAAFWMDQYPVTNAEFENFIHDSHYRPEDTTNFLRDWKNGTYPTGWANKPVTWVSIDDARAYAKWAGKRLPHEWEWQYVAQGTDGRTYPWGNEWNASAVPAANQSRIARPPDDVNAHPKGESPFHVFDLTGNVWQWTDEYRDEHTRAAIVRGGSSFQPQGSFWYFQNAYRNTEHGKLLLMAPSMDRSGTIGFRCAMDDDSTEH